MPSLRFAIALALLSCAAPASPAAENAAGPAAMVGDRIGLLEPMPPPSRPVLHIERFPRGEKAC